MKKKWLKEEDDFILSNYESMSIEGIAIHLNRTRSSVINRIYKIIDYEKRKNVWPDEKIKLLLDNYEKMSFNELSILLDKSISAIDKQLRKLKVDRTKSTSWTVDDDFYLECHWGIMTIKAIAKHLNRTEYAVRRRGYDKKLGGMYFDSIYLTIVDIRDILNVNRSVVENWIEKKGLKASTKRLSKLKTKFIKAEDLYYFLKDNQNLWNAAKVGYYALGHEDEWLINKRNKDSKNPLLLKSNTPWTTSEEEELISYCLKGYSTKKMISLLNRSEDSILCKKKQFRKENRL